MAAVAASLNVPTHATLAGANRKAYIIPVGTQFIHLYATVANVVFDIGPAETDPDGTAPPADAYFTRVAGDTDDHPTLVLSPLTQSRVSAGEVIYFSVAGNTAVVEIAFMGRGL